MAQTTGSGWMFSPDPIDQSLGVLEKLGLLGKIKKGLFSQPEEAAVKLSQAIQYFESGYGFIYKVLVDLTSLTMDSQVLDSEIKMLEYFKEGNLDIESGKISVRCGQLVNIYDCYLKGAINRIFKPKESKELESIFEKLRNSDISFVSTINYVCHNARNVSEALLVEIQGKKDMARAKQMADELRVTLTPAKRKLNRHLVKMLELQEDFYRKAKIT